MPLAFCQPNHWKVSVLFSISKTFLAQIIIILYLYFILYHSVLCCEGKAKLFHC